MKLYCMECLHGTEYLSSKPSNCEKCRKPFFSVNMATTQEITSQKSQNITVTSTKYHSTKEEMEEDDEGITVPEIDSLKVDISRELRANRHDFQYLEGTAQPKQKPRKLIKRNKSKKTIKSKVGIKNLWSSHLQSLDEQNSEE